MDPLFQNNINLAEKQKFAQMAENWWDKTGPMQPLHLINPTRLSYIAQQVSLAGVQVLDIGCGGGILSEGLAGLGANVFAVDINPELIQIANHHQEGKSLNINYQVANINEILASNQQFPVITCMELLEHVPNPCLFVAQCAKLLKPGGMVFFSTLNRTLKSFLAAIIGAEYLFKLLPKGTHDYDQFIKPSELTGWANQAQLKFHHISGISFNPLAQEINKFSLSSNVSVNYIICFEK